MSDHSDSAADAQDAASVPASPGSSTPSAVPPSQNTVHGPGAQQYFTPPNPADEPYHAAAAEAQQYVADNNSNHQPNLKKPKKKRSKKPLLIVLIIILLLTAAGGAYYYLSTKKSTPKTTTSTPPTTTTSTNSAVSSADDGSKTVETEKYQSTVFHLTIEHPKTWTVDDAAANKFTITSPAVQMTGSDGQKVAGRITLQVRTKGTDLTKEFEAGNATAVKASEKITYVKPTQTQRAQTYVTFVRHASSVNVDGAMDMIYITGDNGYQVNQAVPKADIAPVDPIISVTFTTCTNSCASATGAASIQASSWDSPVFQTQLKKMLESLAVN